MGTTQSAWLIKRPPPAPLTDNEERNCCSDPALKIFLVPAAAQDSAARNVMEHILQEAGCRAVPL